MFILMKNGILGKIHKQENERIVFNRINHNGESINGDLIVSDEDNIMCADTNIEILKNKANSILDFTSLVNVVFDLSSLCSSSRMRYQFNRSYFYELKPLIIEKLAKNNIIFFGLKYSWHYVCIPTNAKNF